MYERVLVAIDFSDPSVDALEWVADRYPEAEITVFHALEKADPPGYVKQALGEEVDLARERKLDARTNLEVMVSDRDLSADVAIREGWPPEQVHRAAEEADADLIVVGAHRQRIWPWDEPPGATAEAIAKRARRPVLIWREPPERPAGRTVLGPVALREGPEPVAAEAARQAEFLASRLVLLHVMPRTLQAYLRAVSSPRKVSESLRRIERSAREEARGALPEEYREELEWQVQVARGQPVTQILASAESEAADLVVMGKGHHAGMANRGLLGDVTGKVVRGANCSVLILPPA